MWRWDPIVPEWRWLHSRAPANQRSAGGVGVSTRWGAVSTRRIVVFIPQFVGVADVRMDF